MKALTAEQVASYHHNGFLFPIPALTDEEIATCLAGLHGWRPNLARRSPTPTSNGGPMPMRIRPGSTI